VQTKPTTQCALQKEGLKVTDVVVLIDREQGGAARMASNGLKLYSAFTLSFILEVLVKHSLVNEQVAASVKSFIAANQTFKQDDSATKASADAPAGNAAASGPEAAAAAKAAADAACAAPMPAVFEYKRYFHACQGCCLFSPLFEEYACTYFPSHSVLHDDTGCCILCDMWPPLATLHSYTDAAAVNSPAEPSSRCHL